MIYVSGKKLCIQIQKLDRCNLDDCNIYQLILQHISSKCITVFKVRDTSFNNVRFCFYLEVPDCLPVGEYNYFLVSNNEWVKCDLNQEIIKNTRYYTDKHAFVSNGLKLISNNKLVVLGSFKAVLVSDWQRVSIGDETLTTIVKTNDTKESGAIYHELNILNTGLLKYEYENILPKDIISYSTNDKFKQYEP